MSVKKTLPVYNVLHFHPEQRFFHTICMPPGEGKRFHVFVCLYVTLLNGIEFVQTVSSLSPLNLATILISLDRESFVLFMVALCNRADHNIFIL